MTRERRHAHPPKQPTPQPRRDSAADDRRRRTATHSSASSPLPAPPAAQAAPPPQAIIISRAPTPTPASMLQFFTMEPQPYAHKAENDDSSHSSSSNGNGAVSSRARVPRATRALRTAASTVAHAAGQSTGGHAESALKSYKPRKATHVVRKEEKEELEKQLEMLEAELLGLKYRALFPEMSSSRRSSSSNSSERLHPGFTGDVLRDAIKIQQLSLASVQAVLSNYVRQYKVSPIQTPIRLGSDPAARKATLQALKDAKLAEARRFLAERTRGLDMTKQYSEEERFETDEGDYCVLQFDITPLPKARSVKELFDVLFFFIFNVEIKITETLGSITIREDDECGDKSIAHHRLVSTHRLGMVTEVNTVHFSDFSDAGGVGGVDGVDGAMTTGSGMIVADFVDDDELYPYRPSERVRHDLSAVLTITPERRRVKSRTDPSGPDEEEIVVVLTRWSLIKQHKPQFRTEDDPMLEMREELGSWTDEMLKALRQRAAER